MNEKVSVIIPTYNRFKYLLNAIESVKNQNYKNIEIIIVNDCSIQKEYYNYDFVTRMEAPGVYRFSGVDLFIIPRQYTWYRFRRGTGGVEIGDACFKKLGSDSVVRSSR